VEGRTGAGAAALVDEVLDLLRVSARDRRQLARGDVVRYPVV